MESVRVHFRPWYHPACVWITFAQGHQLATGSNVIQEVITPFSGTRAVAANHNELKPWRARCAKLLVIEAGNELPRWHSFVPVCAADRNLLSQRAQRWIGGKSGINPQMNGWIPKDGDLIQSSTFDKFRGNNYQREEEGGYRILNCGYDMVTVLSLHGLMQGHQRGRISK